LAQEGSKENIHIGCWDKGLAEALEALGLKSIFSNLLY
jgi:hypothetical protein